MDIFGEGGMSEEVDDRNQSRLVILVLRLLLREAAVVGDSQAGTNAGGS